MSKEQLASQVFGLDEEASPDAIEIYVHRLRKEARWPAHRHCYLPWPWLLAGSPTYKPRQFALAAVQPGAVAGAVDARQRHERLLNGREAADTAYDRTLLARRATIAAGLTQVDGTSAIVPYVALDTFAYDSAGRIYYQVNDIDQKLISGYENLPGPPPGTPHRRYPALARFYNAMYLGQQIAIGEPAQGRLGAEHEWHGEIRVAETDEARVAMARSLMADTLLRLGMLAIGALLLVWFVKAPPCARWNACSTA